MNPEDTAGLARDEAHFARQRAERARENAEETVEFHERIVTRPAQARNRKMHVEAYVQPDGSVVTEYGNEYDADDVVECSECGGLSTGYSTCPECRGESR